jgi:RNA polymerase-binding transcription factor DksA
VVGGERARRLVDERARAEARAAELAAEVDAIVEASAGSNADDEHDPEGSTVGFERARVLALLESARQQVVDLDAAIARTATGDEERCEVCGGPIGDERLAAMPATRRCIRCAASPSR